MASEFLLRRLEERLLTVEEKLGLAPPQNAPRPLKSGEREAYELQIRVLREDFLSERRDRENIASRLETVTLQLECAKRENSRLHCQLAAVHNVRSYTYNQQYGTPPPRPFRVGARGEVSDSWEGGEDISDREEKGEEEEEGEGEVCYPEGSGTTYPKTIA